MVKAVGAITAHDNLVKQVVFDLNVLPVASVVASSLSLILGLAFVMIFNLATYHTYR